ncbi:hypothetical protein [Microbacterium sp. NIBRBAC000506063]|uniref:hypothetical protein n=1 Tax=Microbacterium sp. NIBRBAC000506063 TaxID=2734618 RepID=UPI001BB73A3C|nr:hypothetical protein [Microbacterium sp. NIBRBAC000506063]QTV78944.1 hypothetical protein KAE78_07000 [Microbacterium sp. NIBRBAC000506063]
MNSTAYGILVVDDQTIMLGSQFEGALVDPVTNTIQFGQVVGWGEPDEEHEGDPDFEWEDDKPDFLALYHGLEDGMLVVYRARGTTVPGLVDGKTYRVEVIDDTTIRLWDPLVSDAPVAVTGAAVEDDRITVPHHFVNGQLVIYTAPDPAGEFSSGVVNVQAGPDGKPIIVDDPPEGESGG